MRKKRMTPPATSGGAVFFTRSIGETLTSVDENMTTAATGDIVRPKFDATAARTPRCSAPVGSVFAISGSTALQKLTQGAIPEPDRTASVQGKTSVASFDQKPFPETTFTRDVIIPTALIPSMNTRPVMMSEMMFA